MSVKVPYDDERMSPFRNLSGVRQGNVPKFKATKKTCMSVCNAMQHIAAKKKMEMVFEMCIDGTATF